MNPDNNQWFQNQVTESANSLAQSSPELLSPTGRILRQVAAKWFDTSHQFTEPPTRTPELRVFSSKLNATPLRQDQLPLLGSIPEQ